jgi:surface protein
MQRLLDLRNSVQEDRSKESPQGSSLDDSNSNNEICKDIVDWPNDILVQILHALASQPDVRAHRACQQLAFLTCKREALAKSMNNIPKPILLGIRIEPKTQMAFKIPFANATVVCVDVDWGDGCSDMLRKRGDGFVEHQYAAPGYYTVGIFAALDPSGARQASWLDHLGFGGRQVNYKETATWWRPLRDIISLGTIGLRSLSYLFYHSIELKVDLQDLKTGDINDMSGMFCSSLRFNQPIGTWNVGNVTNMSHMFYAAQNFNQPIGDWNVGKVTDMSRMFCHAQSFNQSIVEWDVSNVTNMTHMFHGAHCFNQPIGGWNVSKVTDMYFMFFRAHAFKQPIGDWEVDRQEGIRLSPVGSAME